jgi:hypothetical protein
MEEEVQLDCMTSEDDEGPDEQDPSIEIHKILVKFIRSLNKVEVSRMLTDQKSVIQINKKVEGLGLIHHAAATNSVEMV